MVMIFIEPAATSTSSVQNGFSINFNCDHICSDSISFNARCAERRKKRALCPEYAISSCMNFCFFFLSYLFLISTYFTFVLHCWFRIFDTDDNSFAIVYFLRGVKCKWNAIRLSESAMEMCVCLSSVARAAWYARCTPHCIAHCNTYFAGIWFYFLALLPIESNHNMLHAIVFYYTCDFAMMPMPTHVIIYCGSHEELSANRKERGYKK